jgi:TRAP transporter TAXI family solute receptor
MDGKKIRFAGAGVVGRGTPWGTLGLVVRRALAPYGYETEIESASSQANNPRYVADGRCDIGATQVRAVREAIESRRAFEGEEPRKNLRLIATINQASWIGVAVRPETGITDLSQIAERRQPIRLKTAGDRMFDILFEYYGFSREKIDEFGGSFVPGILSGNRVLNEITPWVKKGEFDAIIDPIYTGYTPEHQHWMEATILYDLQFLPLPEDLIQRIVDADEALGPGFIPHRLMRGINEDIPSVERLPQVIYTRAEAPDAFVHEVTKALDENRHMFRQTHIPYSYDPKTASRSRLPVPFHPAAEQYYKEMGYIH